MSRHRSTLFSRITEPNVGRHLLREEGEVVVDEVHKHWIVFVVPVVECLLALSLVVVTPLTPTDLAWLPFVLGLGVAGHGLYALMRARLDRFVVTNMRVFRVHGVFSQQLATMPLTRILDITVNRPLIGRLLGYGHFCFESAAQEQGLRDITFVGRPHQRDLAIQRVVQRSGLRGPRVVN